MSDPELAWLPTETVAGEARPDEGTQLKTVADVIAFARFIVSVAGIVLFFYKCKFAFRIQFAQRGDDLSSCLFDLRLLGGRH